MERTWAFGEVEAVLAGVHGILSSRRTSFQARLKNLLKLGLLPATARGRGRAGSFTSRDLMLFSVATELTQLNLPPEPLVRLMHAHRHSVAEAIVRAGLGLRSRSTNVTFLVYVPTALLTMMDTEEASCEMLFAADAKDVREHIVSWTEQPGRSRIGLVNVRALLATMISHLPEQQGSDLLDHLQQWDFGQGSGDVDPQA